MLDKVLSFSNLYGFFLRHCICLICSWLNYLCTSWNIQSMSMECLTCRNLVSLYVRWLLRKKYDGSQYSTYIFYLLLIANNLEKIQYSLSHAFYNPWVSKNPINLCVSSPGLLTTLLNHCYSFKVKKNLSYLRALTRTASAPYHILFFFPIFFITMSLSPIVIP